MIGLDTNVLVRYLVQDHPLQSKKAAAFIEKNCSHEAPAFISEIVLCELVWVLESAYGYKKDVIIQALERILMTAQFKVENKDNVWEALSAYRRSKADFSDCLIGAKNHTAGCEKTATFDHALKGMEGFWFISQ